MTKADLVERVTAQISRTAGPMISKKDCARVVDAFLEAIKESLQSQENIEVRGFGTFKIRNRKTRMARNPRTGSPVEVSARPVSIFVGTVRDLSEGRSVERLEYAVYREMAESELTDIMREASEKFGISSLVAEHRIGELTVGDISVAIASADAHRAGAIECTRF